MNRRILAVLLIVLGVLLTGALYYLTHVLPSRTLPQTLPAAAPVTPTGAILSGFNGPFSVALDAAGHRLFVADARNNRVLVFLLDGNNVPATTTPRYVLGQPNFTSRRSATAPNGMNYPHGVTFDAINERLFVTDTSNSRVLVFDVAPGVIANGEDADRVLGQPNFTSIAARTARNRMNAPYNTAYDPANNRLFVADDGNNRILVFDVAPGVIANGEDADRVLGQPDFTSRRTASSWNGLNSANGLAYDPSGRRLFVVDTSNNRVLVFDASPGMITNGEGAVNVLGQPNFASSVARTARDGMDYPYNAFYDPNGGILFVADSRNNRILEFDASALTIMDGENALHVFGQPDFTAHASTAATDGMNDPYGVAYDASGQNLFIADTANNRILLMPATGAAQ